MYHMREVGSRERVVTTNLGAGGGGENGCGMTVYVSARTNFSFLFHRFLCASFSPKASVSLSSYERWGITRSACVGVACSGLCCADMDGVECT